MPRRTVPAALAGLCGLAATVAAEVVPLDAVDVPVASPAAAARVAMRRDGTSFVVVWQAPDGGSPGAAGDSGIFARLFNDLWQPTGPAFRVNVTLDGSQLRPAVAIDDAGRFAVVWEAYGQDGDSAGETNLYLRRFQADGTPLDAVDVLVNTGASAGSQFDADVSVDGASSRFVVVWSGGEFLVEDIFAKAYVGIAAGASGTPTVAFAEIRVNDPAASPDDQTAPTVAIDPAGRVVVAWQSFGQDAPGNFGIYLRRIDPDGTLVGGEVAVNTVTEGAQQFPKLAPAANGGCVVAWQSEGVDGDGLGIVLQRYDSTGLALGRNAIVNSSTAGSQSEPRLASTSVGGFVVAWRSAEPDGGLGSDVFYRRYDAAGAPLGSQLPVNPPTGDGQAQANPSVAVCEAADFVILVEEPGSALGLRRFGEAPAVAFAAGSQSIAENSSPALVGLVRSASPYVLANLVTSLILSRPPGAAGGSAAAGTNFVDPGLPALLTLPVGSPFGNLAIPILRDHVAGPDTTLVLALSLAPNSADQTLGMATTHTLTIRNVDRPPPRAPRVVTLGNHASGTSLSVLGEPGEGYIVEASADLQAAWQDLSGTLVADETGGFQFVDATQPRPTRRFYRIRVQP